jgi:hypothetical protein
MDQIPSQRVPKRSSIFDKIIKLIASDENPTPPDLKYYL